VFVSSPTDVAAERGRVQAIAATFNREYQGLVSFETVLWEEHFYKADRSFQPQIAESVACDIVVSIFWTRIGTELPADFARMPDGRPYPSGTAYELLTALDASKRRDVPDGEVKLTHAAYDALGGLSGAIAAEAEQAAATLSPTSLDALPRLLRRLAEPARDGKGLTLREVPRTETSADSWEATLVDALLGARILIARTDAMGHPTVRLAHDAVLASWPRAKEAAQASREFYRVRAEVEDALRRWQEHHRPRDRLIQPGVPLAEAEKLVNDFRTELPAELTGRWLRATGRARANA
jgi:Novel STAND NTPase 1